MRVYRCISVCIPIYNAHRFVDFGITYDRYMASKEDII